MTNFDSPLRMLELMDTEEHENTHIYYTYSHFERSKNHLSFENYYH